MDDIIIWAKISTSFEGFHSYPDAPDEVSFLRNLHRHIFNITVWLQQFHDERDIEYILFKRELAKWIENLPKDNSASCERIAAGIARTIRERYPDRMLRVEVLEDAENGAVIELLKVQ